MARTCCTEFDRAGLVRRAAAEAGRGLPAIEPGMPVPAGTGLSRRSFLLRSAGLALAVYGGGRLGIRALEDGVAQAAANDRVLVSVFLEGGADSLSLLFPSGDGRYHDLRPKLALPASAGVAFGEDVRLRWHPALAPLAQLHTEGKVTVLPAVGYDHPDQSHFTSRHYWEVGATDANLRTGWLGRYLDHVGSADNPLQGLALDDQLQPALATARVPVATIEAVDQYDFWARGVWGDVEEAMLKAIGSFGAIRYGDPALDATASVARQVNTLRNQLAPFADDDDGNPRFGSRVAYPKSDEAFPSRLAGLVAMLAAGLPLHCVTLSAPGSYDTHANQADELQKGLSLTADSLLAFQRDLEARGLADRVLVHVWSEFGRRGAENGSAGTDHGAAGTGFLIGTRVRGRMIGEFPGLAHGLDADGNLRATSDFRGVYAALLEQWLATDAAAVLPNAAAFARPSLIR